MTSRRAWLTTSMVVVACACGGSTGVDGAAGDDTAASAESSTSASSTSSSTTSLTSTTVVTTITTTTAPPPSYTFPVQPADAASYSPAHHDYPAADIFAPCGSSIVAVTDGEISELATSDVWDPSVNDGATRGGLSVTLVGDDGARYYGSHLATIAADLQPGVRVSSGQVLGTVGDTGNAAGTGCHLHFGISPPCGVGDWEVRRGTIPPAPFLDAWRSGDTTSSPVPEVLAWREGHVDRCPP